jgi:hypothetical protein
MENTVATEILRQLGSSQFVLLTGAKSFTGSANGLSFQLPRGAKNGVNGVRITLLPSDTYRVEFLKVNSRKGEFAPVSAHEDVYCDMLADLFEAETGLYVSLRPRR